MPCEVCENIDLEIIMDEDDISLDVDFAGEFVSGATGEEYQRGYDEGFDKGEKVGYEAGYAEGLPVIPTDLEWVKYTTEMRIDFSNYTDEVVALTFDAPMSINDDFITSKINDTLKHIILNFNAPPTNLYRAFFRIIDGGVPALERITINGDTSQVTSFGQFVRSLTSSLKTIDGTPLDFSSATAVHSFCSRCWILSYVRVVPNTIKVNADFSGSYSWDDDSLQSIIDGLADLTGLTAQTLTMHTDVKARIESNSVWLATIVSKNWNLA